MNFSAAAKEYRLRGAVGDGAAGVVRKATDLETNDIVAVKFLAPDPKYIDRRAFDDVEQRFRREGLRGAGLAHDNLVKVIAYEDNNGGSAFQSGDVKNPFIVMELVPGRTLESLIRNLDNRGNNDTTITPTTISIAVRIVRALRHLHERKIVHRDVKPANVFLSSTATRGVPATVGRRYLPER